MSPRSNELAALLAALGQKRTPKPLTRGWLEALLSTPLSQGEVAADAATKGAEANKSVRNWIQFMFPGRKFTEKQLKKGRGKKLLGLMGDMLRAKEEPSADTAPGVSAKDEAYWKRILADKRFAKKEGGVRFTRQIARDVLAVVKASDASDQIGAFLRSQRVGDYDLHVRGEGGSPSFADLVQRVMKDPKTLPEARKAVGAMFLEFPSATESSKGSATKEAAYWERVLTDTEFAQREGMKGLSAGKTPAAQKKAAADGLAAIRTAARSWKDAGGTSVGREWVTPGRSAAQSKELQAKAVAVLEQVAKTGKIPEPGPGGYKGKLLPGVAQTVQGQAGASEAQVKVPPKKQPVYQQRRPVPASASKKHERIESLKQMTQTAQTSPSSARRAEAMKALGPLMGAGSQTGGAGVVDARVLAALGIPAALAAKLLGGAAGPAAAQTGGKTMPQGAAGGGGILAALMAMMGLTQGALPPGGPAQGLLPPGRGIEGTVLGARTRPSARPSAGLPVLAGTSRVVGGGAGGGAGVGGGAAALPLLLGAGIPGGGAGVGVGAAGAAGKASPMGGLLTMANLKTAGVGLILGLLISHLTSRMTASKDIETAGRLQMAQTPPPELMAMQARMPGQAQTNQMLQQMLMAQMMGGGGGQRMSPYEIGG